MAKIKLDRAIEVALSQIAADRREFLRKLLVGLAAVAALPVLSSDLLAQGSAPAAEITAINETTGVVTAKVKSSGQLFQFTLANKTQLGQLKVGQPVFANFGARQISFDGKQPAGTIISIPTASKGAPNVASKGFPTGSKGVPSGIKGVAPVDGIITNINAGTGVVTAKVNSTGEFFTFTVADASQLKALKTGQRVFANFGTKQVSFDGKAPAGTITKGPGNAVKGYDIQNNTRQ